MKFKEILTKQNIIILIVLLVWSFIALFQFFDTLNDVFLVNRIAYDNTMVVGKNVFFKEHITKNIFTIMAIFAFILFILRKKIGWVLLAICMVLYIVTLAFYHLEYYSFYMYGINSLDISNDEYRQEIYPSVIRILFKIILVLFFHCALLWLICLKRIRNIYNINIRVAVLTISITLFLILFHNLVIDKNAVKIEQVESNEQVIIRYDRKRDKIFLVQFPFTFEYKNYSLKNRNVDFTYVYKANYKNLYPSNTTRLFYKIEDKLATESGLPRYAGIINIFKSQQLYVQTFHSVRSIDTTNVIQVHFKPYIEKIKISDYDTLCVGTVKDFVERNPQLTEILLKGDSVRIYTDKTKELVLPIKY